MYQSAAAAGAASTKQSAIAERTCFMGGTIPGSPSPARRAAGTSEQPHPRHSTTPHHSPGLKVQSGRNCWVKIRFDLWTILTVVNFNRGHADPRGRPTARHRLNRRDEARNSARENHRTQLIAFGAVFRCSKRRLPLVFMAGQAPCLSWSLGLRPSRYRRDARPTNLLETGHRTLGKEYFPALVIIKARYKPGSVA